MPNLEPNLPPPRRVTPLEMPAVPRDGLRFPLTRAQLVARVKEALDEDGAFNDITTIATVRSDRRARAALVARQGGTIAGIPFALETFRALDPKASMRVDKEDGKRAMRGDTVVISVSLMTGAESATVWGCDLTDGYVRINADYTT